MASLALFFYVHYLIINKTLGLIEGDFDRIIKLNEYKLTYQKARIRGLRRIVILTSGTELRLQYRGKRVKRSS